VGLRNPIKEQQIMENAPVFVGLDHHSKRVQVCVMAREGTVLVNRKCGDSVAEIGAAVGPGREVVRAAIESCCGVADLADGMIADWC
jgi:hypothetical protein